MIFITGATGFIGNKLVRKLADKGHKVRGFVLKDDKNVSLIKDLNADIVYGDVLDQKSIEEALDGIDIVIHLAALVGSSNEELCMKINTEGTRNVIEACKKKVVKRIIYTTSVAATFKHLATYGKTKLEAEKLLMDSSLDVTLIRPTLVYGKNGLEFEKVVSFVKKFPIIPMIGSGNALKQPVYVDDVVSIIAKVIENKDTIGKTYPVGGPDVVTFNTFLNMIGEELGRKKPIFHIPKWMCYAMARAFKLITKNPPITSEQVSDIDEDAVVDNTDTIVRFNYRPIKLREGLRISLK